MTLVLNIDQECKHSFEKRGEAFDYVKSKLSTFPQRKYYIFDGNCVYHIYSHYRKIFCDIIGNDPGQKNIKFLL